MGICCCSVWSGKGGTQANGDEEGDGDRKKNKDIRLSRGDEWRLIKCLLTGEKGGRKEVKRDKGAEGDRERRVYRCC